ncbi:methyltransferase domain-containing protein [Candidatus Peregrinibacteria bacterium]|nr:methyltransferase domain-containing protein [Candidatus Peregrinibacteria bacterium]
MKTFDEQQEKYWHAGYQLDRRDPSHPVIRAYAEPKIAFICEKISLPSGARILDVGAGNGYFSVHWSKWGDVLATDYSDVMLQNNPVYKKQVMDARDLKFPDNSFDMVFCHAVLHHIDKVDRPRVMREMARVSKKYVAMIEPNILNPIIAAFSTLKREEHGALVFTPRYVRSLLTNADLRIVDARTWGLLTPNRMPFSKQLLPLFQQFERPLPFGVTNIVIGEKTNA